MADGRVEMTISKRLLALVGVAAIGLALVAAMGLYEIDKVYTAASVSAEDVVPSLLDLAKANDALTKLRLDLWKHVALDDAAGKQEVAVEIDAYAKTFDEALNVYEKNDISDDKDRALLQADRAEMTRFRTVLGQLLELSRSGRKAEAQALALTQPALRVAAAMRAHIQYNVQVGAKATKDAQAAKADAFHIALGISALTALAVLLFGFFIHRQVNSGLRNAQQTITSIGASLDFTLRAEVKGRDEIAQTLTSFNQLIERLQSSLRALQGGVHEVVQTSGELLGASCQVAESSSNQSESSSHMAASVEQMTVSIAHVAQRAGEATELSSAAGEKAQDGRHVIDRTVGDIHAIATAVEGVAGVLQQLEANSKEIATVVNVVREVADQTNLLALNAAIEAARAGESGRGFAVVADEVRKLAERTTASTEEISAKIAAIQAASGNAAARMQEAVHTVEHGVTRANTAVQSMNEIFDASTRSVHLVTEISDAIREQGGAITAISRQVEQVAQMAEENSSAASQAAAMAQRLEEVSGNMRAVVAAYRL
jgi:methyl-accepting chemotaxis protein